VLQAVKKKGVTVNPEKTIRKIVEENNIDPVALFEIIRSVAMGS